MVSRQGCFRCAYSIALNGGTCPGTRTPGLAAQVLSGARCQLPKGRVEPVQGDSVAGGNSRRSPTLHRGRAQGFRMDPRRKTRGREIATERTDSQMPGKISGPARSGRTGSKSSIDETRQSHHACNCQKTLRQGCQPGGLRCGQSGPADLRDGEPRQDHSGLRIPNRSSFPPDAEPGMTGKDLFKEP